MRDSAGGGSLIKYKLYEAIEAKGERIDSLFIGKKRNVKVILKQGLEIDFQSLCTG